MKTTMLEYFKMILSKVSFDHRLFRKEYKKSLARLSESEANELRVWARQNRVTLAQQS